MANVQDIYNEINRIGVAKNGIAGAIEEKGVDVPAEAKIEEYPELVRQIQQGSRDAVLYTPQDLTQEQKQQARTNIGATAPEIFWAEYGVTLYSDIVNEVNSGKVVALLYNGRVYIISQTNFLDSVWFIADAGTQVFRIRCTNTDQWTQDIVYVEITANKSQSVPNDRANTTKYPSVKAVADSLGKWGVVSHTLRWTGSNETGWTAVITNPVYGLIPQANIDLYVAAGAVFNETTGYFELGVETNLSYEEISDIYSRRSPVAINAMYYNSFIRAIFPFGGGGASAQTNNILYNCGRIKYVPEIKIGTYPYIFGSNLFYNCYNLEVIDATIFNPPIANDASYTGCYKLRSVKVRTLAKNIKFGDSPLLDLASVVYMVSNANNTAAITITLHATAYARCQADTTEYTYQGNTYTGVLAYASAKNITIESA